MSIYLYIHTHTKCSLQKDTRRLFSKKHVFKFFLLYLFFKYVFIWLCCVLVTAHRILTVAGRIFELLVAACGL